MAVPWSEVLKKVQLRWKVGNLKREWDVLRKWVYFEANFKNRSAFLKVGQWNKMAQTRSTVRDTVLSHLSFGRENPSHQMLCTVQNEYLCHRSHFPRYSLLLYLIYVPSKR